MHYCNVLTIAWIIGWYLVSFSYVERLCLLQFFKNFLLVLALQLVIVVYINIVRTEFHGLLNQYSSGRVRPHLKALLDSRVENNVYAIYMVILKSIFTQYTKGVGMLTSDGWFWIKISNNLVVLTSKILSASVASCFNIVAVFQWQFFWHFSHQLAFPLGCVDFYNALVCVCCSHMFFIHQATSSVDSLAQTYGAQIF